MPACVRAYVRVCEEVCVCIRVREEEAENERERMCSPTVSCSQSHEDSTEIFLEEEKVSFFNDLFHRQTFIQKPVFPSFQIEMFDSFSAEAKNNIQQCYSFSSLKSASKIAVWQFKKTFSHGLFRRWRRWPLARELI